MTIASSVNGGSKNLVGLRDPPAVDRFPGSEPGRAKPKEREPRKFRLTERVITLLSIHTIHIPCNLTGFCCLRHLVRVFAGAKCS